MLALSCWPREVVVVGPNIIVYVGEIRESKVRIGIEAPHEYKILRMDLLIKILEDNGYRFVGVDGQSLMYRKGDKVLNVVMAVKELIRDGKMKSALEDFNNPGNGNNGKVII